MKGKQFNICCHGSNCYDGDNEEKLASVVRARGYKTGGWITSNQVENKSGKYLWHGLRIADGAIPVTINKVGYNGEDVTTRLYNLDQTNFQKRYPGVYSLISEGKLPKDAVQRILEQPVQSKMLAKAMETGKAEPKTFWQRVVAIF